MVGIVVHLLVIDEHFFFVWNSYVSGNSDNFSRVSARCRVKVTLRHTSYCHK